MTAWHADSWQLPSASRASTLPLLSAAGKQSKLFELLPLDDEQLEALAEKGRVGLAGLSEIPSMTVTALRGRVKQCLEERRQATDALFEEKNKCGVDAAFERPADALQPDDRIESLSRPPARRGGQGLCRWQRLRVLGRWRAAESRPRPRAHAAQPAGEGGRRSFPVEGGVDAAFETRAATAAGHVTTATLPYRSLRKAPKHSV